MVAKKIIRASINGVDVRNVKTFLDHEGAPVCQGDIYIDGKKQGFWSQDSWGGPDNFDFNTATLKERAKQWYKKHPNVDTLAFYGKKPEEVDFDNLPMKDPDRMIEIEANLVDDILNLAEALKTYKKWSKQGYPFMGKLTFIHGLWPIPREAGQLVGALSREGIDKMLKEYTDKYPYAKVEVFEKIEDFIKAA